MVYLCWSRPKNSVGTAVIKNLLVRESLILTRKNPAKSTTTSNQHLSKIMIWGVCLSTITDQGVLNMALKCPHSENFTTVFTTNWGMLRNVDRWLFMNHNRHCIYICVCVCVCRKHNLFAIGFHNMYLFYISMYPLIISYRYLSVYTSSRPSFHPSILSISPSIHLATYVDLFYFHSPHLPIQESFIESKKLGNPQEDT